MTTLTLPHTITPTGLQMHPIAKERLRKFCAGKDRLWVTYDDRKPKRSTSQNAYYWAVVLPTISAETGEEASGKLSKLEIVEIPDGVEYEIDQYDGMETIREKHRSW